LIFAQGCFSSVNKILFAQATTVRIGARSSSHSDTLIMPQMMSLANARNRLLTNLPAQFDARSGEIVSLQKRANDNTILSIREVDPPGG
jgi:hypothetical protein